MKSFGLIMLVAAFGMTATLHAQIGPVDPLMQTPPDQTGTQDSVIKASTIDEQLEKKAYNAGVEFMQAGDFENAMSKFDEAIGYKPDYVEAYVNRANIKWQQGDIESAIEDFRQAISIEATADAYFGLGQCYYKDNKRDSAMASYTESLALDPMHAQASYYRGGLYFEQGEYEKAVSDYDKAIAADPLYAYAYNDRGSAKRQLEKYMEAAADYQKACSLDSNSVFMYNNGGSALRHAC